VCWDPLDVDAVSFAQCGHTGYVEDRGERWNQTELQTESDWRARPQERVVRKDWQSVSFWMLLRRWRSWRAEITAGPGSWQLLQHESWKPGDLPDELQWHKTLSVDVYCQAGCGSNVGRYQPVCPKIWLVINEPMLTLHWRVGLQGWNHPIFQLINEGQKQRLYLWSLAMEADPGRSFPGGKHQATGTWRRQWQSPIMTSILHLQPRTVYCVVQPSILQQWLWQCLECGADRVLKVWL